MQENKISASIPKNAQINTFLRNILDSILKVSLDCDQMLETMQDCENITETLVSMVDATPNHLQVKIFTTRLQDLHGMLGEIEANKIMVDLILHEYRTMFERINGISAHEMSNLMKESEDFRYNYKYFLACQGKTAELNQRLSACRKRCAQYSLQPMQRAHRPSMTSSHPTKDERRGGVNDAGLDPYIEASLLTEIEDLRQMLKDQAEEAHCDVIELQQDLFEAQQKTDTTPGALLFFSTMHDPSIVENLQQMLLQVANVKRMLFGNEHVDFMTLKKRIQVCVTLCPSIEKLLDKYFQLYKKWSASRLHAFKDRNLTGGAADVQQTCPCCFQERSGDELQPATKLLTNPNPPLKRTSRRMALPSNQPPLSGRGGGGGGGGGGAVAMSSSAPFLINSVRMPTTG